MTTLKKQQYNVQGQADGQIQSNGTFIAMILMHTFPRKYIKSIIHS